MAENQFISTEELYEAFKKCQGVAIDSRAVQQDDLFFALKGEQADGHIYVQSALDRGARFAVISDPAYQHNEQCLLVEDVLKALQDLARFHRQQFTIPVIGITGSNGKTTTKELLSAVLSKGYQCHFTKGNFNNHIGVPLTLLGMPMTSEVAVIEMGANHIGEIKELCEIALPTHGIITNIGKAHLEGFGGLEGVKKAKSELYRFLESHNGVAFINKDEAHLSELSEGLKHRRVFYGRQSAAENVYWLRGQGRIMSNGCIELTFWDDHDKAIVVNTQLVGEYNLPNLITASALGLYFKVDTKQIEEVLAQYIPKANRSQLIQSGKRTLILDAYNANPTSMEEALKNLAAMPAEKKVAILGSMKEMGDYAQAEHQRILELAMSFDLDALITVGEEFESAANSQSVMNFHSVSDLKEAMPELPEAATILIKGSRSIRLEELTAILT